MDKIQLISVGHFIGVIYPDGTSIYINHKTLKDILYDMESNSIVMIESRGLSIVLYLKDVVNDEGNPFDSLDDLWNWILNPEGDSAIQEDVTHLTIVVTHEGAIVIHTY